jgi:hypothetical protein
MIRDTDFHGRMRTDYVKKIKKNQYDPCACVRVQYETFKQKCRVARSVISIQLDIVSGLLEIFQIEDLDSATKFSQMLNMTTDMRIQRIKFGSSFLFVVILERPSCS